MPQAITRPNPPRDYAERANLPLDREDADVVEMAVERTLGTAPDMTPRQRWATEMLCFPLTNVTSWIRYHAGEAWNVYSEYRAQAGTLYCPNLDDPTDVCDRMARMPEGLRDSLNAVFVGLECEADANGFFRIWFAALKRNFNHTLTAIKPASAVADWEHLRRCQQVVKDTTPDFAQFFDSLRDFIGVRTCSSGSWRQGDGR